MINIGKYLLSGGNVRAKVNTAQIRQVIQYLDDAYDDLRALSRAGVDVGYPQGLVERAIDDLTASLPEET